MIRSGPRSLNTASQDNELPIFSRLFIHCSWFSEYKRKVISKFIHIYLSVLKTNAIAKLSSKPILLHPSNPCRFLMGKLMELVLKCYRNHNLFLFCVMSNRGRQKMLKCAADAYFGVYLYIFTNSFDPSEAKKFVVSALMCALFPNSAIS